MLTFGVTFIHRSLIPTQLLERVDIAQDLHRVINISLKNNLPTYQLWRYM